MNVGYTFSFPIYLHSTLFYLMLCFCHSSSGKYSYFLTRLTFLVYSISSRERRRIICLDQCCSRHGLVSRTPSAPKLLKPRWALRGFEETDLLHYHNASIKRLAAYKIAEPQGWALI